MKKFYLIFALFFGLTFNLSAQETVIAVWDFADNSDRGYSSRFFRYGKP